MSQIVAKSASFVHANSPVDLSSAANRNLEIIYFDDNAGIVDFTMYTPTYRRNIRIVKIANAGTTFGTAGSTLRKSGAERINGANADFPLPGSTAAAPAEYDLVWDGSQWIAVG
jgi:hypothetical protein